MTLQGLGLLRGLNAARGWELMGAGGLFFYRGQLVASGAQSCFCWSTFGPPVKGLFHWFASVTLRLAEMSLSLCFQPLCSSPFQKHYFPIDYTVQVQYEEVLRPSNITRLVRQRQGAVP